MAAAAAASSSSSSTAIPFLLSGISSSQYARGYSYGELANRILNAKGLEELATHCVIQFFAQVFRFRSPFTSVDLPREMRGLYRHPPSDIAAQCPKCFGRAHTPCTLCGVLPVMFDIFTAITGHHQLDKTPAFGHYVNTMKDFVFGEHKRQHDARCAHARAKNPSDFSDKIANSLSSSGATESFVPAAAGGGGGGGGSYTASQSSTTTTATKMVDTSMHTVVGVILGDEAYNGPDCVSVGLTMEDARTEAKRVVTEQALVRMRRAASGGITAADRKVFDQRVKEQLAKNASDPNAPLLVRQRQKRPKTAPAEASTIAEKEEEHKKERLTRETLSTQLDSLREMVEPQSYWELNESRLEADMRGRVDVTLLREVLREKRIKECRDLARTPRIEPRCPVQLQPLINAVDRASYASDDVGQMKQVIGLDKQIEDCAFQTRILTAKYLRLHEKRFKPPEGDRGSSSSSTFRTWFVAQGVVDYRTLTRKLELGQLCINAPNLLYLSSTRYSSKLWYDNGLRILQSEMDQFKRECPAEFEMTWTVSPQQKSPPPQSPRPAAAAAAAAAAATGNLHQT